MKYQGTRDLLWHRLEPTNWFVHHREPNPEFELPENVQRAILINLLLAVLLSLFTGILQSLTPFYFVPLLALAFVAIVWAATKRWQNDTLNVALTMSCILLGTTNSLVLPLLMLGLAYLYVDVTGCIVAKFVDTLGKTCERPERSFIYTVFRAPEQLLEEERLQLVNHFPGCWREGLVRKFNLARTFQGLQNANQEHRAARLSLLIGAPLIGVAAIAFRYAWGLSYWFAPWLIASLWVSMVAFLPICFGPDYGFNHAADDDKEFAIRGWLKTDTKHRIALVACLYYFTALLVVRPANYFPFPYLPDRVQVTSSLLEHAGDVHDEESAREFLNATPENWIISSLYAVVTLQPGAHWHALTLLLSTALTFLVPFAIANVLLDGLLRPVPARYGHEIAFTKKNIELGIMREMVFTDLEEDE